MELGNSQWEERQNLKVQKVCGKSYLGTVVHLYTANEKNAFGFYKGGCVCLLQEWTLQLLSCAFRNTLFHNVISTMQNTVVLQFKIK